MCFLLLLSWMRAGLMRYIYFAIVKQIAVNTLWKILWGIEYTNTFFAIYVVDSLYY